MSVKIPEVISQKDVVDQSHELLKQKEHLELVLEQTEHKLKSIETSLAENEHLKEQVKKLMLESTALFDTEKMRKAALYPDIYLKVLTSTLDQIAAQGG